MPELAGTFGSLLAVVADVVAAAARPTFVPDPTSAAPPAAALPRSRRRLSPPGALSSAIGSGIWSSPGMVFPLVSWMTLRLAALRPTRGDQHLNVRLFHHLATRGRAT